MAIQWSVPVWMWPLLLVMAAGAVVWTVAVYGRTRPAPGPGLRRVLIALRGTAFGLLLLAVAGPVASCLGRQRVPAELVVVVEDSGSLALTDAAPDSNADSRWRRALDEAAAIDSLFAAQRPDVRREFLRGNGLQPLRQFDLRDPRLPAPTAHGTSLTSLVRRLRERVAGRPVRAVVLVSDGAETVRDRDDGRLANAAAALPLHVVGVGALAGPPDRSVQDVRHPPIAYAGDEVVVDFAIEQAALPPGPVAPLVVTLRDDQGVVAADTLDALGTVVPGQLGFRPRGEGLQALQLTASPLVAERYLENNRVTLAVDVRRDRARVLVVAAVPGWDVRFLAQAAARERRLALTVAYPAAGGLVLADSLRPWRAPTTAAGWRRWDAVVLTGWTGQGARLDWPSLGEAVDQGLGLLVLPSAVVTPAGDPASVGPPGALAALLPVDPVPWRWETGARFAAVAAGGAGQAVLEGVGDAGGGPGLRQLPPWRQVARVSARAGATVLLEAVANGSPDEATGTAALPALVTATRGEGRVAWFGVRQVWEWAFWELPGAAPAGDAQPARRVLRNLLVWLAGGAGQAGLEFTARPGVYQEGQPIRLGARWLDLRGEPVTDREPSLELRPSGPGADSLAVRTFALVPRPGEPGSSEVELPPLAPGRYQAHLLGPGDPPVAGPAAELVVTDTSIERTQIRQDRARLEQLAARAAGDYVDLADAGAVEALHARLLDRDWRGSDDQRRRRFDLWSGWPFLVLVVGLLGTEWFLRRRHGLL